MRFTVYIDADRRLACERTRPMENSLATLAVGGLYLWVSAMRLAMVSRLLLMGYTSRSGKKKPTVQTRDDKTITPNTTTNNNTATTTAVVVWRLVRVSQSVCAYVYAPPDPQTFNTVVRVVRFCVYISPAHLHTECKHYQHNAKAYYKQASTENIHIVKEYTQPANNNKNTSKNST